jgi:hypothetical protein
LEREGYLEVDHHEVREKRYVRHNDPLLRFVHRQTGSLLRSVTGEQILPSYSYLSAYMEGAELKRHTDRSQCTWNASLLLDTRGKAAASASWPFYMKTHGKNRAVRLDLGDTVIYRGQSTPHWRPRLPSGLRQTLALFHYVPIEFTGSLD